MSVNRSLSAAHFPLLDRVRKQLVAGRSLRNENGALRPGALAILFMTAYLCGWMAEQALPQVLREPDTFGAQKIYDQKAVTSLLGEFRGTLAGVLYARAQEYLHGGVWMRPITEAEAASGMETYDANKVGVIPDAAHDHRGIWGDIERDTAPFTHVHRDRDRVQLLPLFRLMTWSDPHFIEGYSLGAYLVFCCAPNRRLERTLEFLQEGVDNNPDSYLLHSELGQYQLNSMHNPSLAQQHFLMAAQAVERIPREQWSKMDDPDREEAERAWEYLVLTFRRQGDRQSELAWARRGLKCFPDSMTLHRSLQKRFGSPSGTHLPEKRSAL